MDTNLTALEERYNLEKDFIKLESSIKKIKPKSILIQLPDGLKVYATEIAKKVKEVSRKVNKREVLVKIWLGSCFGACDIPNSESDLLVQFGHAPWC